VLLWGTAFWAIRVGVDDVAPAHLTMYRLWVSAAVLIAWCYGRGHRLPAPVPKNARRWGWLIALGFFGAGYPFAAIAVGTVHMSSALAAILTSINPIATVALAALFVREETLTARKLVGVAIGFVGAVVLIGPGALSDLGGPMTWAQLAVMSAATAYAINAIIAYRAPSMPAEIAAAGMIMCGAMWITPLGLWDAFHGSDMSSRAFLVSLFLGAGSSGAASVIYLQLVRSAGPSFMSLTNYFVPVTALLVGLGFGERPGFSAYIGLGVILLGVGLASRRPRPTRG
jgi:drug/metabolite transporter (DMT)-like permease